MSDLNDNSTPSIPALPSNASPDIPLPAYAMRLARESKNYFDRFAQEHVVLLKQRRYTKDGDLVEINATHFASPDMTREELISFLKDALDYFESGGEYRLALSPEQLNEDPLNFMMSHADEDSELFDDSADESDDADEDEDEEDAGDEYTRN